MRKSNLYVFLSSVMGVCSPNDPNEGQALGHARNLSTHQAKRVCELKNQRSKSTSYLFSRLSFDRPETHQAALMQPEN